MTARIRVLAAIALAIIPLGVACASSGDLEATNVELAQAQSDLAAAAQRLADLEAQMTAAQAALETGDAGLEKSIGTLETGQSELRTTIAAVRSDLSSADGRLTSLTDDLGGRLDAANGRLSAAESDVLTNKSSIAATTKDLTDAQADIDAVTIQSNDLKASFLLTRDDVAANKDAIAATNTAMGEDNQYALIAHLHFLWSKTIFNTTAEGALDEMVRSAITATGDSALQSAWTAYLAAYDASVNDQTSRAKIRDWLDKRAAFAVLLSQKLSDALGQ